MRLTTSADGVEAGGPSSGRGAWLCRGDVIGTGDDRDHGDGHRRRLSSACLEAALARRAFDRAWRRPLRPDEADTLRRLAADDDSHRSR